MILPGPDRLCGTLLSIAKLWWKKIPMLPSKHLASVSEFAERILDYLFIHNVTTSSTTQPINSLPTTFSGLTKKPTIVCSVFQFPCKHTPIMAKSNLWGSGERCGNTVCGVSTLKSREKWAVIQTQSKQDATAWPIKVQSHVANRDKNNELI